MHLSDEQLHEYLDRAITPQARGEVVRHLAACADCAARLTALQVLFAQIESLPDAQLSRDLAGPVTRALRPAPAVNMPQDKVLHGRGTLPRWVRLTAGLEAALAVLALAFAAPIMTELVSPWIASYPLPSLAELIVELQSQWLLWTQSMSEFTLPRIPSLAVDISSLALTTIALVAFLVWVVGN